MACWVASSLADCWCGGVVGESCYPIRVYSPRQIAGIRKACQIGREVLDIAGQQQQQQPAEHRHEGGCGSVAAADASAAGGRWYCCGVLLLAGRAVRAGVTTDELDRIVYEACVER